MLTDDLLLPFQVEGAELRGRVVRLGPVADTILSRHDYPEPVSRLLGESLALCALLASALKFDGIFTLQVKGEGPLSTLVADFRTPGDLRGYAGFDEAAVAREMAEGDPSAGLVQRYLGKGYLAFTVDQGEHMERYQGIVELSGPSLSDCVHNYFVQSEQLQTSLRVAARRVRLAGGDESWRAGGIMLQRLPPSGNAPDTETLDETWARTTMLMGTASDRELTQADLEPRRLLFRLFHEDGVRVWDPQPVGDSCRCSREKVQHVLRSFPAAEIADMADDGRITVTCQFCNTAYDFPVASVLQAD